MAPIIVSLVTLTAIAFCASAFGLVQFGQTRTGSHGYECGTTRRLGRGDYFIVPAFPPVDFYFGARFGLGEFGGRGERECTWSFKAVDECVLEFHTTGFERGNVNCDEQYLLIGDENREQRICGFRRPPPLLRSTGRHLFLTHYSQTVRPNREPILSCIEGVVSCKEVDKACSPWQNQTCMQGGAGGCSIAFGDDCDFMANVTGGNQLPSARITCQSNTTHVCATRLFNCFSFTTKTCDAPFPTLPGNVIPAGLNCTTLATACPVATPNCTLALNLSFSHNPILISCSRVPPTPLRCSAQIGVCTFRRPIIL